LRRSSRDRRWGPLQRPGDLVHPEPPLPQRADPFAFPATTGTDPTGHAPRRSPAAVRRAGSASNTRWFPAIPSCRQASAVPTPDAINAQHSSFGTSRRLRPGLPMSHSHSRTKAPVSWSVWSCRGHQEDGGGEPEECQHEQHVTGTQPPVDGAADAGSSRGRSGPTALSARPDRVVGLMDSSTGGSVADACADGRWPGHRSWDVDDGRTRDPRTAREPE